MDLMMGKKEEKFREELGTHVEDVGLCLAALREAFTWFFDKNDTSKCYEVIELESKADKQRRKVQAELFEGALFPTLRGDFFNLIEITDHVANQAEDVADILAFVNPSIPKDYHKDMINIVDETIEAFNLLKQSMKSMEDTTNSMSIIGKIREKEKAVDDIRRELIKNIFANKGKTEDKMALKELVETLAKITNIIEDVSDVLYIMIIKLHG